MWLKGCLTISTNRCKGILNSIHHYNARGKSPPCWQKGRNIGNACFNMRSRLAIYTLVAFWKHRPWHPNNKHRSMCTSLEHSPITCSQPSRAKRNLLKKGMSQVSVNVTLCSQRVALLTPQSDVGGYWTRLSNNLIHHATMSGGNHYHADKKGSIYVTPALICDQD